MVPVAQLVEQGIENPCAAVRFRLGAPSLNGRKLPGMPP